MTSMADEDVDEPPEVVECLDVPVDPGLYDSVNTTAHSDLVNTSEVVGIPPEEELGFGGPHDYLFGDGSVDEEDDDVVVDNTDDDPGFNRADAEGEATRALLAGVSSPGDESDAVAVVPSSTATSSPDAPSGGLWTAPTAVTNERQLQALLQRIPGRKDLPDIPRPQEPVLAPNLPVTAKLAAIQRFIESFEYNYAGVPFVPLRKDRGIISVMSSAKEIIAKALPIQCIEAVFLGVYLTREMKEVRWRGNGACAGTAFDKRVRVCRWLWRPLPARPVSGVLQVQRERAHVPSHRIGDQVQGARCDSPGGGAARRRVAGYPHH